MKRQRVIKRFMKCLMMCLFLAVGTGFACMPSYGESLTGYAGIISGVYDDTDEIIQDSSIMKNTDPDEAGEAYTELVDENYTNDIEKSLENSKIKVLILSSYSMRDTIVEPEIEGISNILSESSYNISYEFMDSRRYGSKNDIEIYYSYLSNKLLSGKKYNCIIACDDAAIAFLMNHEELIEDVPVVFMGVQDEKNIKAVEDYDNITGITEKYDYEGNIRSIHNMLPKVKKLYVIVDNSYVGRLDYSKFLEVKELYDDFEWNFINFSETAINEIGDILQSLDSDSAVIVSDLYETNDGQVNSFEYNAAILTEYSSVPVFCFAYDLTEIGIVGGIVYDSVKAGELAGLMAMQIINGRSISDISIVNETPTKSIYDKNILDKFGISTSLLPQGSTIRNAPPSFAQFWDQYMFIIICVIIIVLAIVAEILLISKRQQRYLSTDYLTGLPNRGFIDDKLRKNSAEKKSYGYIIVDIDDFRSINDLYGNETGDKIIVETAGRLKRNIAGDEIIGRLGGDEFIFLLEDTTNEKIEEYCRSIIRLFDKPVQITDQELSVNVTVGAAIKAEEMDSIAVFNNASEALRYAKDKLRHNYFIFNSDLGKAQIRRRVVKTAVEEALEKDGFEIFFQPQFVTGTDELFGVEALVRLKNKIAGPDEFIPVAEENMSIIKIDRIVTKKTIGQWHSWLEEGYDLPPVSINFSNIQLGDRSYPNYVFEKLAQYNVDPSYVVIEITESSFLTTSSKTTDYFNKFIDGGIRLSIDDYGTGYSSLSYLNRLPFSCLKIDKSLISTEPTKENLFMIEKIVEIAHSRNYKVVAEGVETYEQEDFLKSIGCDSIQGFLRGKPMRADELVKLLKKV